MEAIKETVKNVIRELVEKKSGLSEETPEDRLKKVLTKKEYEHIKFNYFKKGILDIKVDSSGWLYRLSLKKEDLLKQLNGKTNRIKDIRFRIGEIK